MEGSSIVWQIEAEEAGAYSVELRYANGGANARNASLQVADQQGAAMDFASTGVWTSWTADTATIELASGANTITLIALSGDGLANIDSLTVYGNNLSAGVCEEPSPTPEPSPEPSSTPIPTATPTPTPEPTITPTPSSPSGLVKLHPIGDSTTEAYEYPTAWRYWLWKSLDGGDFNVDFVGSRKGTNKGQNFDDNDWDMDHDGHTSAKSSEVLNGNLPRNHTGSLREWAPEYAADLAVVYLGTNDIRGRRSTEDIIGTFEEIVAELRAANSGVDIVICTLPYWNYGRFGGSEAAVDALNAAIPSLSQLATAESRIEIVDLNSDYTLDDLRDGIHPGESGAKKIAERLLPVVSEFLNTP